MATELSLYNTLTGAKETFAPLRPPHVGLYVCGPTVYGPAHLGHARPYITFDLLLRYLNFLNYKVRYVRNITDVGHLVDDADEGEDKIARRARLERVEPMELVQRYTLAFHRAMEQLGNLPPSIEPRASGHIPEQIEMIQTLIDSGFAYAVNGSVYFDLDAYRARYPYGQLSGRVVDDLVAGAGNERRALASQSEKRKPEDFALWKKAEPEHIMRWNSPWGLGFPGWHIECSAMAQAYLGAKFDIHAGGLDLIFPHHENEIAQSNGAGYPFAQRWLHNAWVTTAGEKMSKSLGNTLRIHELLKRVRGIELRWYLGSAHYRSMLEYSPEALDESAVNFRRIESFLKRAASQLGKVPETFISDEFANAMNDDLAVPAALAVISELVKEGNNALAAKDSKILEVSSAQVRGALAVLGCDPWDDTWAKNDAGLEDVLSGLMKTLLQEREEARARKDFASADRIRDRITELGLTLEDTPDGPRWSR